MSITYNNKTDLDGVPNQLEIAWTWVFPLAGDYAETTRPLPPGFVCELVTNPGTPAPTDNYDITITDSDGTDVLKGVGADRDTANSERAVPLENSVPTPTEFTGPLTLNITNAGGESQGVAKLLLRFPR